MAISYDADESMGRSPSPVHGMALHQALHSRTDKRKTNTGPRVEVSSRAELIESLKRGESPTWVPNPALEALIAQYNAPPDKFSDQSNTMSQHSDKDEIPSEVANNHPEFEIERPRSALHSGDFDDSDQSMPEFSLPPSRHRPTSIFPPQSNAPPRPIQSPSMGHNLSSSFAFQAPTSPLARATNLELETDLGRGPPSPEIASRRRTLPPDSYLSLRSPPSDVTNFSRPFLGLRRESSQPYQAHQPRRSSLLSTSNPMTPMSRSRRTSFSDHSPRQRAAMVGSFEESILRGRMSTAPSKPLDFIAQIGSLGGGDCKSNLRFPKHVTVSFPAVFYNYPSVGSRSLADESPSPYVGTIDLEHQLKPVNLSTRRRVSDPASSVEATLRDLTASEGTPIELDTDRQRPAREPDSPPISLGGCYRVAKKGQVQIVIKNPNRTAVKFFLVPYSLDGMKPGTKTFVRQRSFSAGPSIEQAVCGNPTPVRDALQKKSILRYLIHLKFCCPTKGRYYLYGDIRVVFANRVPDGKEKLRFEVQVPEPRYSSFRPDRELMGSAGAKLAADKARRRSSGFGLTPISIDAMDGLTLGSEAPSFSFQRLVSRKAEVKLGEEREDHSADRSTFAGLAPFIPSTGSRDSSDTDLSVEPFARTVSPTLSDYGEGLLSRELRMLQEQEKIAGQPLPPS